MCAIIAVPALAAQDGYKYREPAPVIEKQGLITVDVPCQHIGDVSYNFDASSAALINSQADGRIVNNKAHVIAEHNLETAASGYSPQYGTVSKGGDSYQGSSNSFSTGQGYIQNGLASSQFQTGHVSSSQPPPPVNYIPLTQIQPPPQPPPRGHQITQVPPPVSLISNSLSSGSNYAQGYNYQHVSNGGKQVQVGPAFAALPPTIHANHRPHNIGLPPNAAINVAASQHSSSNYASQNSANFAGQHSTNFAGATGQHSANGYQYAPNFAGTHASHTGHGGLQHSTNYASQHATNFGAAHSSHAGNYGSQQAATNFAGQHSSNLAQQQHAAASASQISSNFASQLASSFGNHQTGSISSFSSSSLGAEGLNGQLGSVIRETVANAPLDPLAEKHIYVHIPPEDIEGSNDQASLVAPQFLPPPKKHYKIVFIKAPSHNTPSYSQLAAAAAPKVEEKTLIYVLSKKPEEPSLEHLQQLSQHHHKSSKPEVYFIKYKTQREGEAIQNHITNTIGLSPDQIDLTNGGDSSNLIDIRAGGANAALSSGSSYSSSGSSSSSLSSSSSSSSSFNSGGLVERKKHDLYGVPLQ
uniref:DUF243 domain-containing protein n=1 Tax=Stomoxys calcitrans TaxID=35570 RepID=A0A1I8P4Q7_STOCA